MHKPAALKMKVSIEVDRSTNVVCLLAMWNPQRPVKKDPGTTPQESSEF